jgi:hypothetical protein
MRLAYELIPLSLYLEQAHRAASLMVTMVMNAINPNQLTPAERLDEIADLLAAGLMRLRARKSSTLSNDRGESSLDCFGYQSGHARPREHGAQG